MATRYPFAGPIGWLVKLILALIKFFYWLIRLVIWILRRLFPKRD